jgi:hypothetical protein
MKFDDTELQLHEAEKARRRERFVKRTGAVHRRPNTKDRRRESQDNHSRAGKRAIRAEINA